MNTYKRHRFQLGVRRQQLTFWYHWWISNSPCTRVSSADAMLCPCSPTTIRITGIYIARLINASTEIPDACRGPFFGEMKKKAIHGWGFW